MDEMDWALVKVKGDMTSSATGVAGEHGAEKFPLKKQKSLETNARLCCSKGR